MLELLEELAMRPDLRSLVISTLLVALLCVQQFAAVATTSPPIARSPPPERAIPWIDDILRKLDPSWFFEALGKVIQWKTGKSATESKHIAERVGCLIANGSTSPEHIHTALNYAQPVIPISLSEAQAISGSIAEFKASNPSLFDQAKKLLKKLCG
jgi:hypothetical protein